MLDLNAASGDVGQAVVKWLVQEVFVPVLHGDQAVMTEIHRCGGGMVIEEGAMTFTLPDLHRCVLCLHGRPSGLDDFSAFRRALYGFGVNLVLREHGGRVVAFAPHSDPVRRLYRLQRAES